MNRAAAGLVTSSSAWSLWGMRCGWSCRRLAVPLIAALFYLAGTALYIWARRESRLPAFTKPETVVVAVVALTSVAAVLLMATGNLSVL